MSMLRRLGCLAMLLVSSVGCPGTGRSEGLDVATLPDNVRGDYLVFAQRCSKCHSLARPLNSGIDDDEYWAMYVARMKAQPGSGISSEDAAVILRYLHYYSVEQRRKKEKPSEPTPAPSGSAPDSPPRAQLPSPGTP